MERVASGQYESWAMRTPATKAPNFGSLPTGCVIAESNTMGNLLHVIRVDKSTPMSRRVSVGPVDIAMLLATGGQRR